MQTTLSSWAHTATPTDTATPGLLARRTRAQRGQKGLPLPVQGQNQEHTSSDQWALGPAQGLPHHEAPEGRDPSQCEGWPPIPKLEGVC